MPKPIPLPTQQELHELFDYSVITGELYWKKKTANRIKIGDTVGTVRGMYKATRVAGTQFLVHRLIWVWVTGEDPGALFVDHVNEDKLCNAWHNLRLATNAQNMRNIKGSKGYYRTSKSNPWRVKIRVNGKQKHVGDFSTEAEAAAAYKEASLKHHGEFSSYSE